MRETYDASQSTVWAALEFLATWWLQASILLVVGVCAAWLCRKPVYQSTISRVSLVVILVCPLLSGVVSSLGFSIWMVDLKSWMTATVEPSTSMPALREAPAHVESTGATKTIPPPSLSTVQRSPFESFQYATARGDELAGNQDGLPGREPQDAAPFGLATDQYKVEPAVSLWSWPWMGLIAIGTWCISALVHLCLVVRDLYHARQMLSRSVQAEPTCSLHCQGLAKRLGTRVPRVLINPLLSSPCLVGHWNPAILLPEDVEPAGLQQIFLHELAHLRRGDWAWAILGRVVCSLFWFQPLAWWLHRLNLSVAEDICDDYVIQYDGHREDYLRQLLNIAERSVPQAIPAGVSMVGFRSKLGRRALRILDTTRALSTHAGRRFLVITLLTALLTSLGSSFLVVGQDTAPGNHDDGQTTTSETAATATPNTVAEPVAVTQDPAPQRPANLARTYTGKVLAPDGKPVAGATIKAINQAGTRAVANNKVLATAQSDSDGSYWLRFQPEDGLNTVIASAPGYGEDIVDFSKLHELYEKGETRLDLQLSKLKPITGRVVDTEGRPVKGATLEILRHSLPVSESAVASWSSKSYDNELTGQRLGMEQDVRVTSTRYPERVSRTYDAGDAPRVVTDATGNFRLENIGENSLVHVRISGPDIALNETQLVARDMQPISAFEHWISNGDYRHHGNQATIVASPSERIVGKVTEANTGEPLAGMRVIVKRLGKSTWIEGVIAAVTDATGRFELSGAPLGGGHIVEVQPASDQPYFTTYIEMPPGGAQPIECNFQLAKTKWIRGRVTDGQGQGVAAFLEYHPYRDNVYAEKFKNFNPEIMGSAPTQDDRTSANGEFRIKAIPGRGVVTAYAVDNQMQPLYVPNRVEGLLERVGGEQMAKTYNGFSADFFDCMVEVEIDPKQEEITQDLKFQLGTERKLKITSGTGNAPQTVHALGRTWLRMLETNLKLEDGMLTIAGLAERENRLVILLTADRLFGAQTIVSGEPEPIEVKLEKCSLVRGRVVDADGKPIKGVSINVDARNPRSPDTWSRQIEVVPTNERGEFMAHLPSGGDYHLWAYTGQGPNFFVRISPKAGDDYDVGEVHNGTEITELDLEKHRIAGPETQPNAQASKVQLMQDALAKKLTKAIAVRGTVKLPDGSVARQAPVAIIATRLEGRMWVGSDVLAEGHTNASGQFELKVTDATEQSHAAANVFVRTGDYALAWRKVALDELVQDVGAIPLVPAAPISVQLLDLEGQAAGNVTLAVQSVILRQREVGSTDGIGYHDLAKPPTAWIGPLRTDENGILTVPGIAADQGVMLKVQPSDRFATQGIALNTGWSETRGENDATYRDIVKNIKPGEAAKIPLSPAHIFEGTVRLGEDGPPAAGVKVLVWASQQEFGGSSIAVEGQTDANGRYRIIPYPGIRYALQAFPPQDSSYQIKRLEDLTWKEAAGRKVIDMDLPKGLASRGQVVDATTGAPVPNASVQYWPMDTNPNQNASVTTGWQGIKRTDAEGRFTLSVLPGEGWLLVHALNGNYELEQETERGLAIGKPGGHRVYAHAFVKLNVKKDSDADAQRIQLRPGREVTIEVRDPDGHPVEGARLFSRLSISETSPQDWRGMHAATSRKGQAVLRGLGKDQSVPVYILDAQRKLGTTVTINGQSASVVAKLEPCGSAEFLLTDEEGKHSAGQKLTVTMVVTPGVTFWGDEQDQARLFADEDFIQNIDHKNHREDQSDNSGRLMITALIPGATYRYHNSQRKPVDFVVKSGETIQLAR